MKQAGCPSAPAPGYATGFRMTHQTKHFNKGQMVFVQRFTGDQAALVAGRLRGRWRYVSAWVKWGTEDKPFPRLIEVSMDAGVAAILATGSSHNIEAKPRAKQNNEQKKP